jgi:hypothetical protein
LYERIILRDWDGVLRELDFHGIGDPRGAASLYCIERYARDLMDSGRVELPSRFAPHPVASPAIWERLVAEQQAIFLFRLARRVEAAGPAFEARMALGPPGPGLDFWVEYGYWAMEVGNRDLIDRCLREILHLDKDYFMRNPDHALAAMITSDAP